MLPTTPVRFATQAALTLLAAIALLRTGGWALAAIVPALVFYSLTKFGLAALTARRHRTEVKPDPKTPRDPVWEKLETMELQSISGTSLTFSARLADETGWTAEYAHRAIDEYRRFLYLKHVCEHQVTPSPAIDKVWHMHLVHSYHYWNELCGRILQEPFHHMPAVGKIGE